MACIDMGGCMELFWVPSFVWMRIRHRMTRTEVSRPPATVQDRSPFPALPNLKRKVIVRNTPKLMVYAFPFQMTLYQIRCILDRTGCGIASPNRLVLYQFPSLSLSLSYNESPPTVPCGKPDKKVS